jgi:hypothetical protein
MSEGASPNDPIFYLHHSFVDMIWAAWQDRWQAPYLPDSGARDHQNLTDTLWRLPDMTPQGMLDHRALGYVYDRELEHNGGAPWWSAMAQSVEGGPAKAQAALAARPRSAGVRSLFNCIINPGGY